MIKVALVAGALVFAASPAQAAARVPAPQVWVDCVFGPTSYVNSHFCEEVRRTHGLPRIG